VALPIIWGASSLVFQSPVLMVQIGGVMTGVFLIGVLAATWYVRATETDRRVRGGIPFGVLLVISTIAIGVLAVYTVTSTLGVFKIG
jgi:hypothetical protein